jgi:hypothetical protein
LKKLLLKVSEYTGVDLKVTDPIVGTGVNSISTGTPFVDTKSFQPFDPKAVLDINKKNISNSTGKCTGDKRSRDYSWIQLYG